MRRTREDLKKVELVEKLIGPHIDGGFCMSIHPEYNIRGTSRQTLAIVVQDATRFKNECLTQLRLHAKHTDEYEAVMFVLGYYTLGKYGTADVIYDF